MQDFAKLLSGEMESYNNKAYTQNGAVAYATTGRSLLDLNFSVAQMRGMEQLELARRFEAAYDEDPRLAMLWLFYLRDARSGLGERDAFRAILEWLAETKPEVVGKLIGAQTLYTTLMGEIIPYYGRWDDLLWLMGTPLKYKVAEVIKTQLEVDLQSMQEQKPVTLMAKWLPTINGTKGSRHLAYALTRLMKMRHSDYRQAIIDLRKYIDVVEVKMTDQRWGEIIYDRVPSNANLLYAKAFLRHDYDRRKAFLEQVKSGEKKIKAGVLQPHEILYKARHSHGDEYETYQALWEALPNTVATGSRVITVCDASFSMTNRINPKSDITKMDVAIALTIYFAERMSGPWKNQFITFSANPRYVNLLDADGSELIDKYNLVKKYDEVANTNIARVFDMLLKTALDFHLSQAELPDTILILSDMEFDRCVKDDGNFDLEVKLFVNIAAKYKSYGYKLPRIVFWNIGSTSEAIPMKDNELGCTLISGFSVNLMNMVMSGEMDPYRALVKELTCGRYCPIDVALGYRTEKQVDEEIFGVKQEEQS